MTSFVQVNHGVAKQDTATNAVPAAPQDQAHLVLRTPADRSGVPYYLFVPEHPTPGTRPIVTVHGISRNASEHAHAFAPFAEHEGRIVVAPLFEVERCRRYQKLVADDCRADQALIAVLQDASKVTGVAIDQVDLFGFSGGAQFAHRFSMLHPSRVASLALSSAGWYTFPTERASFPYGIAPGSTAGKQAHAMLGRFLNIPMLVLVGEKDVQRDAGLRKERRIDRRQGLTRVERAARWARAVRNAAATRGISTDIRFEVLPSCGHSFQECTDHGGLAWRVMNSFGNR